MRLEKEYPMDWVEQMAESLVYEIVEQMSGIVLRRSEPWERLSEGMEIDMITGHVSGDFQIELHFFAQRALFMRLTKNMVGYEPDEEEAQEYAMEFFNILCGRFISELYKASKTSARFFPTEYDRTPERGMPRQNAEDKTVYLTSEQQELAAFSWTAAPVDTILRRNTDG